MKSATDLTPFQSNACLGKMATGPLINVFETKNPSLPYRCRSDGTTGSTNFRLSDRVGRYGSFIDVDIDVASVEVDVASVEVGVASVEVGVASVDVGVASVDVLVFFESFTKEVVCRCCV